MNKRLSFGSCSDASIKDSATNILENTLCALDGVGEENKRKILKELLKRAIIDGMEIERGIWESEIPY